MRAAGATRRERERPQAGLPGSNPRPKLEPVEAVEGVKNAVALAEEAIAEPPPPPDDCMPPACFSFLPLAWIETQSVMTRSSGRQCVP